MPIVRILLCLGTALIFASPAQAGYSRMPSNRTAKIGNSALWITPDTDWNRLGARKGRMAESWTLDGLTLNDLSFYAGIANDKTLFKSPGGKAPPVPTYKSAMTPTDVGKLIEDSYRIANGASDFAVDVAEPATFAGTAGFRIAYHYTALTDEVERKGEATGATIGGKLYLITFEAPVIYYFDRDIDSYHRLITTARTTASAPLRR